MSSNMRGFIDGLDDITDNIKKTSVQKYKGFKAVSDSLFSGIKGIAGFGMGGIGFLTNLVSALDPFKLVTQALSDIFDVWGSILQSGFTPVVEHLFDIFTSDAVLSLFQTLADLATEFFVALEPLIPGLTTLVALLAEWLIIGLEPLFDVISTMAPTFEMLGTTLSLLSDMFSALTPIFKALRIEGSSLGELLNSIIVPVLMYINLWIYQATERIRILIEKLTIAFAIIGEMLGIRKPTEPEMPIGSEPVIGTVPGVFDVLHLPTGAVIKESGIVRLEKDEIVVNPKRGQQVVNESSAARTVNNYYNIGRADWDVVEELQRNQWLSDVRGGYSNTY